MKRSSPVWREESLCRISTSLHGGAAILTRAAADYGLPRRQSHVMATHRSGCGRLAEAAGAAGFACRMVGVAGTSCHLVHAARDGWASVGVEEGVDELKRALIDQEHVNVAAALKDVVPRELTDKMTVRLGRTPVVLREAVAELGAELVVLGGKHHSAGGRWRGGTTSF